MIKEELKKYIAEYGNSHILIHSDILFGFKLKFENKKQFLQQHIEELMEICSPLDIIMPSFNYDFCKGVPYDIKNTPSQVGTLSEYFRKNIATWRSSTPVFNFSGTGECPIPDNYGTIDPFGKNTIFEFLHKNKGLLLHYGSGFDRGTMLHYGERISNQLIYRYDKQFSGQVIDTNNVIHDCNLIYHVKPKGYNSNYDYTDFKEKLKKENIFKEYKEKRTQIMIGRIDKITEQILICLQKDPFYFLDNDTRKWVEAKYKEINRPFELSDFE